MSPRTPFPIFLHVFLCHSLFQLSISFPLSKLFSAPNYNYIPGYVHSLHGDSAILTSTVLHSIREVKLHISVDQSSVSDEANAFVLLLRVFPSSEIVIWARALPIGSNVALLSSRRVAAFHHSGSKHKICIYNTSDGTIRKCIFDKANDLFLHPPSPLHKTNVPFQAAFNISLHRSPSDAVLLDLTGRGLEPVPKLPISSKKCRRTTALFAYSPRAQDNGTTCFLTTSGIECKGREKYQMSAHCFEDHDKVRSRMLAIVPSFYTANSTHIDVANGQLFISYAQTVNRGRAVSREHLRSWKADRRVIVNLKFGVHTLKPLKWTEMHGSPYRRIIELPDKEPAFFAARVTGIRYLRVKKDLEVTLWTTLNLTGKVRLLKNGIFLKANGKVKFESFSQPLWSVFLGRKKWSAVRRCRCDVATGR